MFLVVLISSVIRLNLFLNDEELLVLNAALS